jgi:hypothetical protein
MMVHACHPSYRGGIGRKIIVQAGPRRNARPYLKIPKAKRAGSMDQVVEHLSRKLKVLNSNPSVSSSFKSFQMSLIK